MASVVRFAIVGLANTILGIAVIYALKWAGEMGDVPANAYGYAVGLIVSFALNRKWTFGHRGAWMPAALRFAVVFLVSYMFNLGTVIFLVRGLGVNGYVAQAAGVVPYAALFYLGSRFVAFRAHDAEIMCSEKTSL